MKEMSDWIVNEEEYLVKQIWLDKKHYKHIQDEHLVFLIEGFPDGLYVAFTDAQVLEARNATKDEARQLMERFNEPSVFEIGMDTNDEAGGD